MILPNVMGGRVSIPVPRRNTAVSDSAPSASELESRSPFPVPRREGVVRPTIPLPVLPLRPSSLLPMSSTPNSPSNFQSILDAALSDYAKQTGIDLVTHPSAQTLQHCNSADAILDLLGEKANQFQAYRDGNRKLINCLKPVVQVLHAVSAILGEAAAMVSLRNQLNSPYLFLSLWFPFQVPFQPTKAILVGVDVLLTVRIVLLSASISL
jgi:fungal STAND N-terminal Goodbye domain